MDQRPDAQQGGRDHPRRAGARVRQGRLRAVPGARAGHQLVPGAAQSGAGGHDPADDRPADRREWRDVTYLDSIGNQTADSSKVSQIRIVLRARTASPIRSGGAGVQDYKVDSVDTWVALRNKPHAGPATADR